MRATTPELTIAVPLIAVLCSFVGVARAADVTVRISADDPNVAAEAMVYAVPLSSEAIAIAKQPAAHAIVDQKGKEFVPLTSIVRVGTSVDFPNSDNIRHQVYSFSPAKVFNLKLYSGRPTAPVAFDKPGVVTLGCNIHDRMIAWVWVVDTPWIAAPDATGTAVLKDLPQGDYTLHVWHPGMNAATNSASVSEPLHIAGANVGKSLRIAAQSVASLRRQLQSHGEVHSIAPPRKEAT